MTSNRSACLALVIVGLLLAAPATRAGLVVRFDTPDVTVGLGDVFDMTIVADISEPVLGWGLDVTIDDASILSTIGLPDIGPAWFAASFTPDGDGLAGLAFPDSIVGTSVLATLTFSADSLGDTFLFLGADDDGLTEGFPLDNIGFAQATYEPAHVVVVPDPTTGVLAIVGLGLVCCRRWRKPNR